MNTLTDVSCAAFDVYKGGECDVCGEINANEYTVKIWSVQYGDDDRQYKFLFGICEKCLKDALKFINMDRSTNGNSDKKE